jgi:hypothetical protein
VPVAVGLLRGSTFVCTTSSVGGSGGARSAMAVVERIIIVGIVCRVWVWNDQTGNTNRLPIRRVDSPYMSPAYCQSLQNAFSGSRAAMEVPSLY